MYIEIKTDTHRGRERCREGERETERHTQKEMETTDRETN